MTICEYTDTCPIKCARKEPNSHRDPFYCAVGGVDARCVPVVPEVAEPEPEMMICGGADASCIECRNCEDGGEHVHDDFCEVSCSAARGSVSTCVPVAAKPMPDTRQATDASWDKLCAAIGAVTVARHEFQELREASLGGGT